MPNEKRLISLPVCLGKEMQVQEWESWYRGLRPGLVVFHYKHICIIYFLKKHTPR